MASTGTDTQPTAPPGGPPGGEAHGRSGRTGLLVGGVILLAMLGMWAWVFGYHISGAWRGETPGRMDDRVFGDRAQVVCQAVEGRLAELPPAADAATPDARADVVAQSNEELDAMVDELAAIPVATERDRGMVDEWLGDWEQFVEDRRSYVERLRTDPGARFYVTQSDRDDAQITEAVDRFAALNDMPACMTPSDLS